MIDPPNTEIDVDEIMRRIKEEVERRKKLSRKETHHEAEQSICKSSPIEENTIKNPFDHFLWKYGRRYKKIIKTVPILKDIAKKQHLRLAHRLGHSHPVTKQSLPGQLDINVLPYYINYHGFLIQVKEQEGLKGRIKSFLFKFIRFFAWWQEQINRALYQELMTQKARMDEKDRWVQELHHQQMSSLKKDLSERGRMVEDLNNKLVLLSQAKDELSQELSDQRVKIGEAEKLMDGLLHQQADHVKRELAERDKVVESLNERLVHFGRVEEELNQGLTIQKEKLDEIEKVAQNFKSAISGMTEEMRDHKLSILDQQRRLALLLEEARKRLPKPIGPKQIKNMLKEEDHLLDAMYVAFEDRFRGTREDIKERLKVYLPYVRQAEIETRSFPILDLGCGRGEWLQLLKENGHIARGVDFNRVMLRQCQELGLDVTESDMIEYLKNQQSNTFGALTGFHILEHLSLKTIISLFDESLRVLKSGGMVIFETPNPENLIVSTCNFYIDPTHRNPLPPELLNFLVESRGFEKTEIIRLRPCTFFKEEMQASQEIRELMSLFNKDQDYAVISYKA